ncbi:amidohydrolase [Microbacterium sp. Gd 4-13]|uniref:amidohydrolase family protein n=1 Tax=Microbacterium sp. Gd 4-13 TaxID=2173179 RepID=UPI000D56D6DA|nr:amidohydrolase family protein [Microbacterium sp. Gd 4-13]PVW03302.1 amidohydrolase [Microbacterium sp. Gd 4-13]
MTDDNRRTHLRIATEEAWAPPELISLYRRHLSERTIDDIGFSSLMGYFLGSTHPQPQAVVARLQSAAEERIADMDATGIDHQVLALTAPGTQVLDAREGIDIARLSNDRLSTLSREHPTRFSALAAVSFEDVDAAVIELRRAVTELGLKGLILNDHIRGSYIDHPRFAPLLSELESLDVPLYLHPNTPPDSMIAPYREAGLDGAVHGFGASAGLHLLRIITSGVLDRHPGLRVVVGHLGEGLPFWLHRIDHMHAKQVASGRYESITPLRQAPSAYFSNQIWLTTSGMPWAPAIMFTREVIGADRVMYAMDYPYQYDAAEVDAQEALPISDDEKADFFERTARKVFSLDF